MIKKYVYLVFVFLIDYGRFLWHFDFKALTYILAKAESLVRSPTKYGPISNYNQMCLSFARGSVWFNKKARVSLWGAI